MRLRLAVSLLFIALTSGSGAAQVPQGNRMAVSLSDGTKLEGTTTAKPGADDVQLRAADGRVHLLRKYGEGYRAVTSEVNWPTYDGVMGGNRYTTLTQIDKTNVKRLAPKWVFTVPNGGRLQVTPLVVDGIMYVTNANECYALDAGNGREIWRYQQPRTKGLIGNAAGGINRGVAVSGDRVFMITDHAHIIGLNRFTGQLLWDTEMADWRQNYNATAAPLAIGSLVLSGTAGGEQGVRGFIAAYDQATGKEVWRFWTVPKRGEPGSETWIGNAIDHPGGVAWMTGVYDAALDLTYWTTGNPSPDLNGDDRLGDNLYTSAVVALDAKTGTLKWYYQFTPHNVWDWDAQQPTVLVDLPWQGKPRPSTSSGRLEPVERRKLMLQVSRNGFFYVLDRTNGELLRATRFAKNLTWAKAIGPDGRPVLNPNQEPSEQGTLVCPSLNGAANWYSTAFSPQTGLYYVQTLENCNIFTKRDEEWVAGKSFWGGAYKQAPEGPNQKVLRAFDVTTGKVAWEQPEIGAGLARGGVLATATGVLFSCDDSDRFLALDASNGKMLWQFPMNVPFRASPMTYQFDKQQYVAVAAGTNIISFGLVE